MAMNNLHENTPNELPGDDEIASRARAIFRTACEQADSYHTLRLGLARRKAVNAGSAHSALKVWAPLAGAAACCALVAGVVWLHPVNRLQPSSPIAVAAPAGFNQGGPDSGDADEAIPEVGSNQMEVVQDLDFYRWLAVQPVMASATPAASGHR
jgi:hypothetical protein